SAKAPRTCSRRSRPPSRAPRTSRRASAWSSAPSSPASTTRPSATSRRSSKSSRASSLRALGPGLCDALWSPYRPSMENSSERLARSRGLGDALPLIAKMELPAPAPADPTLDAAVGADPLAALDVARRRGLDARVVEVFFKWFEKRPLELGLFAWDVLCNALL